MDKVVIAPLVIEDYEAVLSLWRRCAGIGLGQSDTRENIQDFLWRNPGMSFKASLAGKMVGTILVGHDQRRGYVYHLAVHPQKRRQGIGRRLVERSLQALQETGIQKCHLFVCNDKDSGVAFWKSIGWEERTDLQMMSKNLDPTERIKPQKKPKLESPFSIRPMTGEDYPAVKTIFEQGIATGNATFETDAPSWEEWDAGHLQEGRLVAVDGQKVIGWAALSRVCGRWVYAGVAEVSVYVAAGKRGQGIGTGLLQTLIPESEQKGIWTLQSGIFPENEPSIALHRKCGFRLVGRREILGRMKGRWRDVLLFERRSPMIGIGEA